LVVNFNFGRLRLNGREAERVITKFTGTAGVRPVE